MSFRKTKVMRAIGLLACHSTELRDDVPIVEVSWIDYTHFECFSHCLQLFTLISLNINYSFPSISLLTKIWTVG